MNPLTRRRCLRMAGWTATVFALLAGSPRPAFAQLDPLLFMRTVKPNVLLVVDTANRMQRDANNDYYDQFTYTTTGVDWEQPLGVQPGSAQYRRKYVGLGHLDTSLNSDKFVTDTILTISNNQSGINVCSSTDRTPVSFALFSQCTRMAIARNALVRAIQLNQDSVRFGLLKMRQASPAVGAPSPQNSQTGNEGPVKDNDWQQQTPTDYQAGKWHIMRPMVTTPNNLNADPVTPLVPSGSAAGGPLVYRAGATPNVAIAGFLARSPDQGGLIPAGQDAASANGYAPYVDAPVSKMLMDARTEVDGLLSADASAAGRNTVVVLVVGGGEGSTGSDPVAAATAFLNIRSHRVPIYVISIAPLGGDFERAQLQAIATRSGGQYFEVTPAMINATAPGAPVAEFVRAVNSAIQHTFASAGTVNTAPTAALPYGPSSEFQVTSPIIGTVDLSNSVDITGAPLPNSVIMKGSNVIPQRSNVIVTTSVAVPGGDIDVWPGKSSTDTPRTVDTPGFFGRMRAFRVYRPEPDISRTSGFKFVGDGTQLWIARPPMASEGTRNIYTVLPDGTMTAFARANNVTLRPYLGVGNDLTVVNSLIDYVRGLPLGAFLDGTPAFLDAPSLDPPPDADYPGFQAACAGRRTLIFIGGNDGMLHAIDARTGVEVWAFIPFNLLPKLRALRSGQGTDLAHLTAADDRMYPDAVVRHASGFNFFVDGSPKIADVKIGGQWRSYIMFGEGPGGTFYQTLDVTMTDLAAAVSSDSSNIPGLLNYFSDPRRIAYKWSFPNYAHFNYSLNTAATPYGDVDQNLATPAEKSVGQTWSDPAVGQVKNPSGSWVAIAGSGFLPYSQQHQANRGDTPGGTRFYVLDMATGIVLDSRDVGNDGLPRVNGVNEGVDNCVLIGNCTNQKNALQSDPVATGPTNSRFIDTGYVCDLDGNLWKFLLALNGSNAAVISGNATKLFAAGAAQPLFSSMAVVTVGVTPYIFLGSGSDLLPSTGVSQSYNLYAITDVARPTSLTLLRLAAVDGTTGAGERVSAYPAVAGDIVFFTTTTYKAQAWVAADSNLYAFTFVGGPAYDNTGDNRVTSSDTPKVATMAGAGRATAPFVSDQHLVLGAGGNLKFFGDPQDFNNGVGQVAVRILSWREIR